MRARLCLFIPVYSYTTQPLAVLNFNVLIHRYLLILNLKNSISGFVLFHRFLSSRTRIIYLLIY